jgi:DNA recombination protein RmuC
MLYVVLFAAGLLVGFLLAYFFTGGARTAALQQRLEEQQAARVKAETEVAGMQQRLGEERKLIEESKKQLSDTFQALAAQALRSNNASFLELARKSLETLLTEARGDLGKRQEAIDGMVKPLAESLKAMEQARQRDMGGLQQQLASLSALGDKLKTETGNLVNALRAPQVRGRWGEVTLRRVVELAGMSEHCDFTEQVSVEAEGGRLRPDMIVHLPAGRDVVVDAKVSLSAYLQALEAGTEEERQALLLRHAEQVRAHMTRLSQKAYWDQFERAPEFVVMFIPGESFFSAALEQQNGLLEDGMNRRVVLATPTTLIALLWAVAYGWRQQQLAENAQEISRLGKDLYDRMGTLAKYVNDIGYGLDKALSAYNQSVRSMESRLYPAARRFKELGAGAGADIPPIEPVETTTRSLTPPENPEG